MESLVLPPREDFSLNNNDNTEVVEGKICVSPMSTEYSISNLLASSLISNDGWSQTSLIHNIDESEVTEKESEKKIDKFNEETCPCPEQSESRTIGMEDESDNDGTNEKVKSKLGGSFVVVKGKKSEINEIESKYFVKGKTKKEKFLENKGLKNVDSIKFKELKNDDNIKTKKETNWVTVPLSNFNFLNTSLFPRPIKTTFESDDNSRFCYERIEEELDEFENMTQSYKKEEDLEGKQIKRQQCVRADRDRKKIKAHIQIKDKYCRSIKNNRGRKKLFVHHRSYKRMEMDVQRLSYLPSATQQKLALKREEIKALKNNKSPCTSKPAYNRPVAPVAPPQCLAYTLSNHNAQSAEFDNAVVNLLISLQHRELTPEDYDLLLRLDEKVAPKTVEEDILKTFKTETVDESHTIEVCPVCMENYELGQHRKYLPCNHVFHSNCIDMWLKNSSLNCPVDNLPIDVTDR